MERGRPWLRTPPKSMINADEKDLGPFFTGGISLVNIIVTRECEHICDNSCQ